MANVDGGAPPVRLGGTRGAAVWALQTPEGPCAVKVADPARTAREAGVLAALAGFGVAPRLIAAGGGVLVSECVPGSAREATAWTDDDAVAVGRLLRRVHDQAPLAAAGEPRRVPLPADELAGAPALVPPGLAREVIGRVPVRSGSVAVLLHGDPWSGNVVWADNGPLLVDWEFARTGERAEDLAYLAAMDRLPPWVLDAVLAGYGADAAAAEHVQAWRPFMAAWCAVWYARCGDADRSERLAAHAAELVREAGPN